MLAKCIILCVFLPKLDILVSLPALHPTDFFFFGKISAILDSIPASLRYPSDFTIKKKGSHDLFELMVSLKIIFIALFNVQANL